MIAFALPVLWTILMLLCAWVVHQTAPSPGRAGSWPLRVMRSALVAMVALAAGALVADASADVALCSLLATLIALIAGVIAFHVVQFGKV